MIRSFVLGPFRVLGEVFAIPAAGVEVFPDGIVDSRLKNPDGHPLGLRSRRFARSQSTGSATATLVAEGGDQTDETPITVIVDAAPSGRDGVNDRPPLGIGASCYGSAALSRAGAE